MIYAASPYRRDIDGLRAVAIVSVLLFHAFPEHAPGGYVGVDVFFVISGFLITSNIAGNLARGSFSFAEFYIRRVKRIFPALTVVLLATLVIGWLWLLPGEFTALAKQAAAGAAFANNILLWTESGYFDADGKLKPLLHLWSLGIEEQFYLAWPLIVFLSWRFGRRAFHVAAAILAASLIWGLYETPRDPAAAFYLPFSRTWELMLGACLATVPALVRRRSAAEHAASLIGAALIVTAVVTFKTTSAFPGWRALLPCVGAALLLWSGPSAAVNRWILSNPVAVAIGVISYSLYLWHWPLLSFLAIAYLNTAARNAQALMLAVALATATYFVVERPIRRASLRLWPLPAMGMVGAGAIAVAVVVGVIHARVSLRPELATIEEAEKDWVDVRGDHIAYGGQQFVRDGKGDRMVLLIGDSNMEQYFVRIHALVLRDPTLSTIWLTAGGCPPIGGVDNASAPKCRHSTASAYQYAMQLPAQAVVISAEWFGYFNWATYSYDGHQAGTRAAYEGAMTSLERSMEQLVRRGKKVYLVLPMPLGAGFGPETWLRRTLRRGLQIARTDKIKRKDMPPQFASLSRDMRRAAEDAGAVAIDPFDSLCNADACIASENGDPIYMDALHLRARFVRERVRYLDRVFEANPHAPPPFAEESSAAKP